MDYKNVEWEERCAEADVKDTRRQRSKHYNGYGAVARHDGTSKCAKPPGPKVRGRPVAQVLPVVGGDGRSRFTQGDRVMCRLNREWCAFRVGDKK